MEILDRLARLARDDPGRVAVVSVDTDGLTMGAVTFSQVHAMAGRIASGLLAGLGAAPVVILSCRNGPDLAGAFLGVLAAGGTVFPVSAGLSVAELRRAAEESGAVAAIAEGPMRGRLEACGLRTFSATEAADLGAAGERGQRNPVPGGRLLLQSSGTTGLPKIASRSGESLDAVAANVASAVGLRGADRVLAAVPMTHSYGIENVLLGPLWAGACIHALDPVEPAGLERQLAGGAVTVFPGVPFMFEVLGASNAARRPGAADRDSGGPGKLRCVYSAGGPLPPLLEARFTDSWGLRVGQLYGATEIGSVTFNDPGLSEFDASSVGLPMRGVDVRITDPEPTGAGRALPAGAEGQVLVRAPSMLDGYLGVQAPIIGGFFQTGDLGTVDASGRLRITGRLKLLIDVGGIKVNPLEVETVLAGHPDVRECVVVPLRVSDTLSRLRAIVTARAGHVDIESVRGYARERLAAYKVPRIVEVRASLPKSPTGKVLRRQLEAEEAR